MTCQCSKLSASRLCATQVLQDRHLHALDQVLCGLQGQTFASVGPHSKEVETPPGCRAPRGCASTCDSKQGTPGCCESRTPPSATLYTGLQTSVLKHDLEQTGYPTPFSIQEPRRTRDAPVRAGSKRGVAPAGWPPKTAPAPPGSQTPPPAARVPFFLSKPCNMSGCRKSRV